MLPESSIERAAREQREAAEALAREAARREREHHAEVEAQVIAERQARRQAEERDRQAAREQAELEARAEAAAEQAAAAKAAARACRCRAGRAGGGGAAEAAASARERAAEEATARTPPVRRSAGARPARPAGDLRESGETRVQPTVDADPAAAAGGRDLRPGRARAAVSVWDEVVGQQPTVELLRRAVRSSRGDGAGMTHAWLFTGPPGSGRSVAARAFAAALLCDEDEAGCGTCHSCHTVLTGSHADVTTLRTEGVIISRQQALELLPVAQRRPSTGRWRVILVEDADRLNDSSGNAMLKAIEEPTARTVWLLCAPSADDVLVTIRSRCRHVGLRTPPPQAVADLLVQRDGVDPQMAAFAARAAQSHIGMARRLATDEQARIRRRDVLAVPLKLHGVGEAVMHAAALLDTAKAEAEAGTTERDEAERGRPAARAGRRPVGPHPAAARAQPAQDAGGEPEASGHPLRPRHGGSLAARPAVAVPRRAGAARRPGRPS